MFREWLSKILSQTYSCVRNFSDFPWAGTDFVRPDGNFGSPDGPSRAFSLNTFSLDIPGRWGASNWHTYYSPVALDSDLDCRALTVAHEALHGVIDAKDDEYFFPVSWDSNVWSERVVTYDGEEQYVRNTAKLCFKCPYP
jgi:hypothetical protein